MTTIYVPYHLDEQLPRNDIPLPTSGRTVVVTPDLIGEDVWHRLGGLYDLVATEVAGHVRLGAAPTVVSGDCLVALGVLTGVQRAEIDASIVWFDAHGDLHTVESSTSGYLGGMPLRLMVGAHPELIAQRLGLRAVPESRVVLVGARDLDPGEVDYLASAEIHRCDVDEVSPDVLPDGPILLHIDLDVTDPRDLPGLRFPAPGGPTCASVVAAARRVMATGRVVAVDIACPWHPAEGEDSSIRADLLTALIGP